MFLLLIGGVAFMVLFLTRDGLVDNFHDTVLSLLQYNLALIGGVGALLVVVCFYLLLRWQFTV